MKIGDDFLITAEFLLASGIGRPRQTNLKRAVSTVYYAMFHCLCGVCADKLIGKYRKVQIRRAWKQTYRALEHRQITAKCSNSNMLSRFPAGVRDFAAYIVTIQDKRHDADYDPDSHFLKTDIQQDIKDARHLINQLTSSPVPDQRAFAAYILLRQRNTDS